MCKHGDENYEQPEPTGQFTEVREGVEYKYEEMWDHIVKEVNPQRDAKGLCAISRSDSDIMCRIMENFHRDMSRDPVGTEKPVITVDCFGHAEVMTQERIREMEMRGVDAIMEATAPRNPPELVIDSLPEIPKHVYQAPPKRKQGKWEKHLPPHLRRKMR